MRAQAIRVSSSHLPERSPALNYRAVDRDMASQDERSSTAHGICAMDLEANTLSDFLLISLLSPTVPDD
jgi:hypothetical protein